MPKESKFPLLIEETASKKQYIVKATKELPYGVAFKILKTNYKKAKKAAKIQISGENYPCGPCALPVVCCDCGTIITDENVVFEVCEDECEICNYCGDRKCPNCKAHVCCGGCI